MAGAGKSGEGFNCTIVSIVSAKTGKSSSRELDSKGTANPCGGSLGASRCNHASKPMVIGDVERR